MPVATNEEQRKLSVIQDALQGRITNDQAAKILHLSTRQIKRLKKAVRHEGKTAVIHKLKGRHSNHRIDQKVKEKALAVIAEKYPDFRPTFAIEKLAENHAIQLSYGTTRLWMIERGLWRSRKQKKITYRSWRPRKAYFGEQHDYTTFFFYHNCCIFFLFLYSLVPKTVDFSTHPFTETPVLGVSISKLAFCTLRFLKEEIGVTSYAKNGLQRFSDKFLRQTLLFCREKSSKYLNCSVQLVQV